MKDQQRTQQLVALRDSLERLRRTVEDSAATILRLSAALDQLEAGEPVTETLRSSLDDQAIVLIEDSYTTIVVQTVHGVQDTIRLPRNPRGSQ